jgi:soluble lytic murein transglycosylase-like protein
MDIKDIKHVVSNPAKESYDALKSRIASDDKNAGKAFAQFLISELLKSSDVFGEEESMSYPGIFRWQMATYLSDALKELSDPMEKNLSQNSYGNIASLKELEGITDQVANETGVPADLLKAVIQTESSWRTDVVSPKGAKGLMQLIDSTAERFGVKNVFDPAENIKGGAKFLKHLMSKYNDVKLVLAAYNAGEGAVERFKGIPPFKETEDYVKKITSMLGKLSN